MNNHPFEAEVTLDDGTVVTVTGKLAVDYRRGKTEAVRRVVEEEREKSRRRTNSWEFGEF